MYYTYAHYDMNQKPIYIGKGKNRRAYEARDYGHPYTVKIVDDNLPEMQALELEEFLIEEIGLDNLYNVLPKGYPSGKHNKIALNVDYHNLYQQVSKLNVDDLYQLAETLFNDAAKGNVKAFKIIYKILGKYRQPKINDLLQSYSGKSWKK